MEPLSTLTDMFMEARFSDHDMGPGSVPVARSLYKKVSENLPEEGAIALRPAERAPDEGVRSRWLMRVDHESDLRSLLGDKEVSP
jgi:hypothetical protein